MRWTNGPGRIPILALVLVLATALSGCADGTNARDGLNPVPLAREPGQGTNATVPRVEPWPVLWQDGETERLLVEDTIVSEPPNCAGPADSEVWLGCGNLYLPEGVLLPQGTASLRVEADASEAQRQGPWSAYMLATRTRLWSLGHHWGEGEPTTEDTGTWRFETDALDWDLPIQPESRLVVHFMGHGQPFTAMVGDVHARVYAERDPAWVDQAPVDRFAAALAGAQAGSAPDAAAGGAGDMSVLVAPGVLQLMDVESSFQQPSQAAVDAGLADRQDPLPFHSPIPVGTSQLVVAVSWEPLACPQGMECSVRVDLESPRWWIGGYSNHPAAEAHDQWVVYVYDVPVDVLPEPDAASTQSLFVYAFQQCPPGADGLDPCKRTLLDTPLKVRARVEAWQGPADLAAAVARLAGA